MALVIIPMAEFLENPGVQLFLDQTGFTPERVITHLLNGYEYFDNVHDDDDRRAWLETLLKPPSFIVYEGTHVDDWQELMRHLEFVAGVFCRGMDRYRDRWNATYPNMRLQRIIGLDIVVDVDADPHQLEACSRCA